MRVNDRSIRRYRLCAIVARVGLVLSLWQAPIPWIHHHGTSLPECASPLASCVFRHHIEAFHSPMEANSDEEFGWHCHWILPSWTDAAEKMTDVQHSAPETGLCNAAAPFDDKIVENLLFSVTTLSQDIWESILFDRSLLIPQKAPLPRSRQQFSFVLRC